MIPKWDRTKYASIVMEAYKNDDEGGLDDIDENEAIAGSVESLELDAADAYIFRGPSGGRRVYCM